MIKYTGQIEIYSEIEDSEIIENLPIDIKLTIEGSSPNIKKVFVNLWKENDIRN